MPRPAPVCPAAPYAAPLRHPYYVSPRAEQRARFREEVAAFLDHQAASRARLAACRILPVVTP